MSWLLVPLSILVIFSGIYVMQQAHYEFLIQQKKKDDVILYSDDWNARCEKLQKDIEECRKRVDKLALKVGFKL